MADFRVVLVEHGYPDKHLEKEIINAAGGEFMDAEDRPLSEALDLCRQADGILVRRTLVTADMIRTFHRCRIIVRYGVGTDNIDVKAATGAGIMVGNVPDYCMDEVSTHAIALLLACVRNLCGTYSRMAHGHWDDSPLVAVSQVAGRSLGLVGLGQIGSAVARKLRAWELRLLACDPFVEDSHALGLGTQLVDLETLCRQSDYISLHVPLLPETHHLIGSEQLKLIKPGCILVNTARGPVVDTRAVLGALDEGRLAWAGLDVFEEEPLPVNSPLRSHPGIILSNHTAWYSEESQRRLQTSAANAIVAACTGGVPASLANPQVLYKLDKFNQWRPAPSMLWQLARLRKSGLMP
ncbi:MAG TPA: C-terminal binding protein [Acidobacteriota bacterium]|nr:C-terminal binding protein [Acidobacteriota bacterium]